jgi:amino acid permease
LGVELCDQSHNLTLRSCFAILSSLFFGAGGVKELKEEFGIFSREKKKKKQSQAKTR